MDEAILVVMAVLLCVGLLVGVPVLALVAYVRSRRVVELAERIERLEASVRGLSAPAPTTIAPATVYNPPQTLGNQPQLAASRTSQISVPTSTQEEPLEALIVATPVDVLERDALGWELLIGRKALGWAAIVVLIFATGFFLRYAFSNRWIGPVGQIAMGAVAGLALVLAGWRLQRRGQKITAQMLAAGGVVLLYLATYSSFGFYHLLDSRAASLFLFIIVVETAMLAIRFEAPTIALMAVLGGLLTPLLMHSDHDQYQDLFLYLIVLNAGVVGLLLMRPWRVIGSLALLGTQALFWAWHFGNYHPEKLAWAIGFQIVIYALYLARALAPSSLGRRAVTEDLFALFANAGFAATAGYVLLDDDYRPWLGTLSLVMAVVYAIAARVLLARGDNRHLQTAALAIASGFIAMAIPLQADAPWVAFGWATEAGVLWWFGLRVSAPALRLLAGVFAMAAVGRIFSDAPWLSQPPLLPILNRFALASLAATAVLGTAIVLTRRMIARATQVDRVLAAIVTVGCLLMVWWIVTYDLHRYFNGQTYGDPADAHARRLGQMSVSAWWAVYATLVLAAGFLARAGLLRWTALGLYAITVANVFLVDMSDLDEIYRIVAFFVLAVLLGVAAWAYQRFGPTHEQETGE